ncbi:MAG: M23 family metallopeptidase [Beijerinckiaceae bacterium]|nr:M23 family metallopeptidase [Beijerinckiaceae bacterium]
MVEANIAPGSSATRWTFADRQLEGSTTRVDLGVEPAIEIDGGMHTEFDRRKVSARWLTGTALTGLAGACLIGAAVHAALNEPSHIALAPESVPKDESSADADTRVNPQKGDRLVRRINIVAARQTYTTPTIVRVGDREIVRRRTFTRVATTLTLVNSSFARSVPPFNPLKLLAGAPSRGETPPGIDLERADADVTFVTHDLTKKAVFPQDPSLSIDEIQAQIREHISNSLKNPDSDPLPIPPQLMLVRTSRTATGVTGPVAYAAIGPSKLTSPFSRINVRMIPENVTVLHKSASPDNGSDGEEKLLVLMPKQSLHAALAKEGASTQHINKIIRALNANRRTRNVGEGQKIKLLFANIDDSQKPQIARISIYTDETLEGSVALADTGEFMPVENLEAGPSDQSARGTAGTGSLRLYSSFYQTALKHHVPPMVINDLVSMFANDVDFNRAVSGGDAFEVFFRKNELKDGDPDILYASITSRGETRKYYRAPAGAGSNGGFFNESGRSTQKFLIRKPVAAGEQRSGFGWRRHPILRYARMHTGVDWATRTGTPIVAAGNGTVIKAKRESGYGNRIEIQHGNGYVTTYSHMVGFARGMREGARVRQGQVIGYVGSTGLSTGAHLHYEVIVNGNYVDPLRIRLARTSQLSSSQLASFRRERDRINMLISKAQIARVATTAGTTK